MDDHNYLTKPDLNLLTQIVAESANACYICDIHSYDLLYINHTAQLYAGHAKAKCYEYWQHRTSPCSFCPLKNMTDHIVPDCHVTLADSGRYLHMRGKVVLWNKKSVLIEYLTDETESNLLLTNALDTAQRSENVKSQFLSRMSHELRTPLNAIIGFSLLAAQDIGHPDNMKAAIEKIEVSARELLSLINNILDLSCMEKGFISLAETCFSLKQLLTSVTCMITTSANSKNIHFCLNSDLPENAQYRGDEERLRQVLLYILENAVKFTPANGSVTLTIDESRHTDTHVLLRFVIRDTGIGMNAHFIPHLFDSFSQESDACTSVSAGTGLGLAISQKLIHLMNGRIYVQSTKGKGSVFTIEVPLGLPEQPSPSIPLSAEKTASLHGKKILLAEDQPLNVEVARRLLEKEGLLVTVAENGQEAVRLFTSSGIGYFDAILMDIRMPVMDGLNASLKIRSLTELGGNRIPIIAMTANAFDKDKRLSLSHGMNAHLTKPIDPELLYATLRRLIKP